MDSIMSTLSAISTATSGLYAASNSLNQAAIQTVQDASQGQATDLVSDFVQQQQSQAAFQANVSVLKTADSMYGSLLNIIT
jgi:flagellar hook-associated protein FlgK